MHTRVEISDGEGQLPQDGALSDHPCLKASLPSALVKNVARSLKTLVQALDRPGSALFNMACVKAWAVVFRVAGC